MSTIQEYKCPACGGAITFDSETQKMKCPFCDTEFDVETLRGYDDVLKQDAQDDMRWETKPHTEWREDEQSGMRVYVCDSCGGEIIGDATLAATSCPYCDNPVVMMEQFSGMLKPDTVIPFKLDKAAAKAGLIQHLKGKRLLPKVFKDDNHIDEVKGIYVPFWLFDTDAQANIRYKATKLRMWSDANYNYTKTSYFAVSRAGTLGFDRVPADGSSKMPDDLMQSLEPFDTRDAVDFQTAYLAGYFADKYDVSSDEGIENANCRIRESTEHTFAETVTGYSTVTPENTAIKLINGHVSYALYPVWLLNTTWKGQKYTFAMNGQTGKFVGNLPIDKGIYWKWFWGLTAGIGAVVYGLSWLIQYL